MRRIRLFTSFYRERDEERAREIDFALRKNLDNESIDEVCLVVEGDADATAYHSRKLKTLRATSRPSFDDFFEWMKREANDQDISILANSDIYFDSQLLLFRSWAPEPDTALCLARWETRSSVPALNDRNDSQDVWIFSGPIRKVDANFPVGVPRCDNRIAFELERAGYRLLNPSFAIRAYHSHAAERSEYPDSGNNFVDGPYRYVWPHNLWSLPQTLLHNATHAESSVAWRPDRRKISRALKLHWFEKLLRLPQRMFAK